MQPYEARRGTVVRVRNGHWKRQFAGMRATVQNLWGQSEHAAVDVLLEDGRSELFWLPDLSVVDGEVDFAVQPSGLMLMGHESKARHNGFKLPFGYYLESDADLLVLRRSDGSFVAAFNVTGVDLFEVELAVWEDADQQSALWLKKDTCPSQIWQQPDKNLTIVQEGGDKDQGQVAPKIARHSAKVCALQYIVICDTTLLAVYDALNATYQQTIPQAVDNPGQSNTKYRARVKKGTRCPLRGVGKGEYGIVCYKTDGAVRAHAVGPSSGADVRRGIVGCSVCIEVTDLHNRLPSVTTTVTMSNYG